jgi:hypothetical protein
MLVILSGADTIGKKLLSRQVVVTMNQFIVDGFRVDFSKRPYEIYNSNNELVLTAVGPSTWVDQHLAPSDTFVPQGERTLLEGAPAADPNYYENYGDNTPVTGTDNVPVGEKESINPIVPPVEIVPLETQAKIKELNQRILDDESSNDFKNLFQDVEYDYGLTDKLEFNVRWGGDSAKDVSYQTIIDNYTNRAYDTFVITGTFSKGLIDKLQADLGADNVKVLNITRNPSVAFMLNKKSSEWYLANPGHTYDWDVMKLEGSLFNCINLKRFSNISTIKFEDILAQGSFTVGNTTIPLPVEFTKFNQYLTAYEKTVIDAEYETETALAGFNTEMSFYLQPSLSDSKERMAEREKAFNRKFTYTDYMHWPNNFFTELGYTSLTTRSAIIS